MNNVKNITTEEYFEKLERVCRQANELDNSILLCHQGGAPVIRVSCKCGCDKDVDIRKMYQCLYCNEWHCTRGAEEHFGKTVHQWREENPNPVLRHQ